MRLLQDKRCGICGCAYKGAFNSKRCPDCQAVYVRAYARHRQAEKYRGKKTGDNKAAHEYAERYARAMANALATTEGRCLYCGKQLGSAKHKYCSACRTNGLANVHEVTGRTNGWNRRRGQHESLKPGWRGQMVMGGGSSRRGPNA